MRDILNSILPNDMKCWTCLGGRQAFIEFRGQKSSYRKIKMGLPQGGDLSPILFNIYITSLQVPAASVAMVSFADYYTVFSLYPLFSKQKLEAIRYYVHMNSLHYVYISIKGNSIAAIYYSKILCIIFHSLHPSSSHATDSNRKQEGNTKQVSRKNLVNG